MIAKTMKKQDFRRENTHFKQFWCIFLVVAMLFIIQISMVSAFEFDNIGRYNQDSKTFTIKNSILGIPFLQLGTVAEIKLNTPQVFNVMRGSDRKVAEFTINNYKDYSKAFKKMEFYDKKNNMKKFDRDFTYKYKKSLGFETVNDYGWVCEDKVYVNGTKYNDCRKELTGTHQKEKFEWIELDTSKEVLIGEITIGIFTDVLPNDEIEWIPTLFGVEIDEWAEWKESFEDGLVAFYQLNSVSGSTAIDWNEDFDGTLTNMNDSNWISDGIIENALWFDWDDDFVNVTSSGSLGNIGTGSLTACFWLNTTIRSSKQSPMYKWIQETPFPIGFIAPMTTTGYASWYTSDGQITGTTDVGDGQWHLVCGVRDIVEDKIYIYVDGLSDQTPIVNNSNLDISNDKSLLIGMSKGADNYTGALDEIGIWNRSLNASEILELWNSGAGLTPVLPGQPPVVTLNSPVTGYNTSIPSITFNCTASDDTGITNVSLLINGTIQQTNTSGINGTNYIFIEVIEGAGYYDWTCRVYDSINRSTTAGVRNFTYSNDLKVTLNSPVVYYNSLSKSITFNGTASDDTAMINVSLYIDGVLNETNSSGMNATDYLFTKDFTDGDYNWTYLICDAVSCLNATKRTFTIDTTPNIQFVSPTYVNNTNSTSSFVPVNVSVTETYFSNLTFDFYNGSVTSFFIDNSTRFINVSLADDSYYYNVTVWTNTSQKNTSVTRNITIDSILPLINITNPTEVINHHRQNTNLSLNWTATDINLASCWYDYNGTNVSVTCSDNTTDINITSYTNRNVTFYVNDTFGNLNNSFRKWEYKIFEVSQVFASQTTEGSSQTFRINVSVSSDYSISSGSLIYNGTSNIGSFMTVDSTTYQFTRDLILPSIATDVNVSFHWNITLTDGTEINSSSNNQTILNLGIDDCSVHGIQIFNFTLVNEKTQAKLNLSWKNTSIKVDIDLYANPNATTPIIEFYHFYNETDPAKVCISDNLQDSFYYAYVQVEYDADSYAHEFYHIQNYTLNSSSNPLQNVTLYILSDDDAEAFKISYKDEIFLAVEGALIQIQRKYVDEGVFKTVEIPKTDSNGEAIGQFVLNDIIYSLTIVKGGKVLATFDNVYAICQNPTIEECLISLNSFSSTIPSTDFYTAKDFAFTLDYNRSSRVITSTFSVPSGAVSNVVLNVTKEDALGTELCSESITTSAGTLTCTVGNSFGNGTVMAKLYSNGNLKGQGQVNLDQSPLDIYGGGLIFLGIFLMLTLIGAGVSDNPISTTLFLIVGVILLFALNLVAHNGFIGATATILWIIVAGILIMIKAARRT